MFKFLINDFAYAFTNLLETLTDALELMLTTLTDYFTILNLRLTTLTDDFMTYDFELTTYDFV